MGLVGAFFRFMERRNAQARLIIISVASPAAEQAEFFLVLSSFGSPVFRRCRRAWVDGALMGVAFRKGPILEKDLKTLGREAGLV
jgi:hypothetical protein